jgi:hypothetical protein
LASLRKKISELELAVPPMLRSKNNENDVEMSLTNKAAMLKRFISLH